MKTTILIFITSVTGFLCLGHNIDFHKDTCSTPRLLKNAVFYEILGNGRYPSINYERILLNQNNFYLSCRLGFSYFYKQRNDFWILKTHKYNFPFMLNGLFRVKRHFLIETGIGVTQQYYQYVDEDYANDTTYYDKYFTTWLTATIGARFQTNHFLISIAFTPLCNLTRNYKTVFADFERLGYGMDPMFGLRLGFCF